ncbi:methyl-accepting chemotaxis protein [Bacillus sp. CGMCC 1.16607]|uniref:methyl-accepting chemotaxis protein n=1 Tax=Bacillus sp. CGMCC 1.16607 TaxID=3351842 RepID=UPI00362AD5E3
MKMTIRKKLFGGFLAVLLKLVVLATVSFFQITAVDNNYSNLIDDKAKKLNMIKDLEIAAKEEQTSLRGYLIIGDDKALQNYNNAREEYKNTSNRLEEMIKISKAKELLNELNNIEKEYREFANNVIQLKQANKPEEYTQMVVNQGREIVNRFSEKASEFSDFQQVVLDDGNSSTSKDVDSIKQVVLLLSILSILIGMVIAYFIGQMISKPIILITNAAGKIAQGNFTNEEIKVKNKDELGNLAISFNQMSSNLRDLIGQVQINSDYVASTAEELSMSAEQTSKASEQITFTVQEIAVGVDKEFKSLEETSQTISEMAAGVHQIASNSKMVSTTALEASEKAEEGGEALKTAVKQMNSIHQTVEGLAKVIEGLGNRSKEISQIIDAITGISAQTNLLALNAAIEAARAGEHGRGFAVVADEVRKLAEQSAFSAQQISHLITSIQVETDIAVKSMNVATNEVLAGIEVINIAGDSFTQIECSVSKVAGQIQEVSSAVQQMAAGSEQLVQSMKYITQIGEMTASSTQEVSAATEEQLATMEEITSSSISLSKMAEDLQQIIGKFKI